MLARPGDLKVDTALMLESMRFGVFVCEIMENVNRVLSIHADISIDMLSNMSNV